MSDAQDRRACGCGMRHARVTADTRLTADATTASFVLYSATEGNDSASSNETMHGKNEGRDGPAVTEMRAEMETASCTAAG